MRYDAVSPRFEEQEEMVDLDIDLQLGRLLGGQHAGDQRDRLNSLYAYRQGALTVDARIILEDATVGVEWHTREDLYNNARKQ